MSDPNPINLNIAPAKTFTAAAATLKQHTTSTFTRDGMRFSGGRSSTIDGIQVYQPTDPYGQTRRNLFKIAMTNPYVKRCVAIQSKFVTGLGYTTKIVPRDDEHLSDEKQKAFEDQTLEMEINIRDIGEKQPKTYMDLKKWVDQHCKDMKLEEAIWWMYYTALQQGRAVVAMIPFDGLPQEFRTIHPDHTLLPVLNDQTNELFGVRIVGLKGRYNNSGILKSENMIYYYRGTNIMLFSDYFGDTPLNDIVEIANNLSIVLKDDANKAAMKSWFTPQVYSVPIGPQDFGKEKTVLDNFLRQVGDPSSSVAAVPTSPDQTQRGVEVISQPTSSNQGIASLETIRLMLIKAIIAIFGIPGFMMSEGDVGQLGGNTNISEIDNYLNVEIAPDRQRVDEIISQQVYDRILCVISGIEDPDDLPCKIIHQYNKPKLFTLLNPATMQAILGWINAQLITVDGALDLLGLQEYAPTEDDKQKNLQFQQQKAEIAAKTKVGISEQSADGGSLGGNSSPDKPANSTSEGVER